MLVDVSGLGHSGKTSVTNLLEEVKNFNVHPPSVELNLLRLPCGLRDLHRVLKDDYSPENVHWLLKNLVPLLTNSSRLYKETLDLEISLDVLMDSLSVEIDTRHWYDSLYVMDSPKRASIKRVLDKTGMIHVFRNLRGLERVNKVYSAPRQDASQAIRLFMGELLNERTVLNNFTGINVSPRDFVIFPDLKVIFVHRDPRDIYASIFSNDIFVPDFERNSKMNQTKLKMQFLKAGNLQEFISNQISVRESILRKEHPNILHIYFEDLVLNYEKTRKNIFDHLSIESTEHKAKFSRFNPNDSSENVFLYKHLPEDIINEMNVSLKKYYYGS